MIDPTATRFRIRQARDSDLPELSTLLNDLFAIEADFDADRGKQRRGLSALLKAEDDRAVILVAEQRGSIVGMVTCQVLISTAEGGPVGLVEDVIVNDGWRSLGIGGSLLQAVERWGVAHGLKRLQLLADAGNGRALGFYERAGWQATQLTARRKRLF